VLAAALAAGVAPAACQESRPGPARIVLVTIDTLRADRVGAYGDLGAHTPHLDELAERGVRFDQAIAPTPVTLPSHTSLMTGLQPPAHGVRHNSVFSLDEEVPVLAGRMGEAGYATAAFVAAFVLDARFGLARGFDTYDDETGQRLASKSPFSFAERRGDAVVDAALRWLEEAPERFFLWVHLYDPHADYDPPASHRRRAGGDAYGGEISFADEQVGRLLRGITRRFGAGDLVVTVTSDHGESLGEHQEATHSYTLYDATQRVPLLLAGAGLPAGRVVEEQVRLVDVAPTLLELAGAPPLEGGAATTAESRGTSEAARIDGRSLLPLLGGGTDERVAYVETLATQLDMDWSPLLGVRTRQHKYIRAPQPELYDLREDPGETRNLALVQPERVRELDALVDEALEGALPLAASVELDDAERARLESLGYVVPDEQSFRRDRELGVVGGPNPRDHMLDVARMQKARDVLSDGRPEEALAILEPVQGGGPQVARTRVQALLDAGHPERAVELLESMQERGEAAIADLTLLGMARLAAGRPGEARAALDAARALDPEAFGPLMGLGHLALEQGELEAAHRWFAAAEERAPQPEAARTLRAAVRLHQGRPQEADALLQEIGAAFLADPARALRLAEAEEAAGRGGRAEVWLRRALEARPEHPRLLAAQAARMEAAGRFDRALALRQRLHGQQPEEPGAMNDLAWSLAVAERDLDRALELARRAASALPGDPNVLDTLATVRLARSEPAEALDAAERALAAQPDASVRRHLLYVRAQALTDLGRREAAAGALRALRAEPGALSAPWKERSEELARRLGLDGRSAEGAPRADAAPSALATP